MTDMERDETVERVAEAITAIVYPQLNATLPSPFGVAAAPQKRKVLDIARAAIAAMPGWQDIESAPKDGTEIILGSPSNSYAGAWQEMQNHWGENGWYGADEFNNHYSFHPDRPTCWQRLPPPPKDSET